MNRRSFIKITTAVSAMMAGGMLFWPRLTAMRPKVFPSTPRRIYVRSDGRPAGAPRFLFDEMGSLEHPFRTMDEAISSLHVRRDAVIVLLPNHRETIVTGLGSGASRPDEKVYRISMPGPRRRHGIITEA